MSLPPESTLDDVIVRIKQSYQNKNKNVGRISHVVLKEGPRAFRIATLMEILDPEKGDIHHHSLKIDQIDRFARKGWFTKPEKSVRIEGDDPNEIERLFRFLHAHSVGALETEDDSKLHIVKTSDYENLASLLTALPNLPSPDKMELLKTLIQEIGESDTDTSDYIQTLSGSNVGVLRHIAAASKFVDYKNAHDHLNDLIEDTSTLEPAFQNHLAANSWMFGSEYSELLDRRKWARDENLDFMLRRTTDGYLEVIEIKRAISTDLFRYDTSHDSYFPSEPLSKVLGQVINYVELLERSRDPILAKDGEDVLKIRTKIIIGRSGNKNQLAALRNFNSHLNGIEILTYDQLLAISKRVLNVFSDTSEQTKNIPIASLEAEEIPF